MKQVFSYERRVKEEKEVESAMHITRDMDKKVIVTQTAMYLVKYQLKEFEYINGQVGYIAKAKVDGKFLRFTLFDNSGKVTTSDEGRVPPMLNINGKLKELDARVSYMHRSIYR